MGIHYLDVDDEVTGAVARLRASADPRVALVLPAGSRVATSRINFRLLAREAAARDLQLSIVAPETAVRAVAIAAGVPAYATVAAYEEAVADQEVQERRERAATDTGPVAQSSLRGGRAAAGSGAAAALTGGGGVTRGDAVSGAPPGAGQSLRELGREPGSVRAPGHPEGTGDGRDALGGSAAAAASAAGTTMPPGRSAGALPTVRARPEEHPRRRRWPVVLLLALVLLAAAGAGAWVVLPSATITITPVGRAVQPVTLSVVADPAASSVDPERLVIPADQVTVPLTAQATFTATGVKVDMTPAKGAVTFSSNNPLDPVTIGAGTTVATSGGVQFQTTSTVVVPKATISGQIITAGTVDAPVTAVNAGTAGNVPAHAIGVVPQRLQNFLVTVDNAAPTTGGTRTEKKIVSQADYDGAVRQLTSRLDQQFATALVAPSTAPSGAQIVSGTESRGDASFAPGADALVSTARDSFQLTATATGTVIAVSQAPLASLAAQRLQASVAPGWSLFGDSVRTQVSDPSVQDGRVTFTVTAHGEEWQTLDATALLAQVKGRSVADARQILGRYGDVSIETWPSFVDTIPTLDPRVTLTIAPPKRMSS